MSTPAQALRIHLGEADRDGHRPLFEAIVLKARELGLAGATVFRSPMGFGGSSVLRTSKILNLSTDLPLVVEIIDSPENLQRLLPYLEEKLPGGLVTIHDVQIVLRKHNPEKTGS